MGMEVCNFGCNMAWKKHDVTLKQHLVYYSGYNKYMWESGYKKNGNEDYETLSIKRAEGGCKLQLAYIAKMYVAQNDNSITILSFVFRPLNVIKYVCYTVEFQFTI